MAPDVPAAVEMRQNHRRRILQAVLGRPRLPAQRRKPGLGRGLRHLLCRHVRIRQGHRTAVMREIQIVGMEIPLRLFVLSVKSERLSGLLE